MNYRGRFAPSPTGPLHAGSLAAALASWLDARAHDGAWLIRIEDVDAARCKPEWAHEQLQQLAAHGLHSDEPVLWQSTRSAAYAEALEELQAQGLVYACHCSRKKISDYWIGQGVDKARHGDLVYPGFCRNATLPVDAGLALRLDVLKTFTLLARHSCVSNEEASVLLRHSRESDGDDFLLLRHSRESGNPDAAVPKPSPQPSPTGRGGKSWIPAFAGMTEPFAGMTGDFSLPFWGRARVGAENPASLTWQDRQLGSLAQNILHEVGDFILRRADACWAYQLAVVTDDAAQGISHVVRGLDLLDNTPRQILLQAALGLPTPQYLHTPLVLAADGQKLSKQNAAAALNSSSPAQCLANVQAAAQALGLPAPPAAGQGLSDYLHSLIAPWQQRWVFGIF
jgi:glutamyl-Q tRNA(Asp) synthetase